MSSISRLNESVQSLLGDAVVDCRCALGELTFDIDAASCVQSCLALRDHSATRFDQLIDLCGMDYSTYGWISTEAPSSGDASGVSGDASRYGVVYHLLSVHHNHRIRLRVLPQQAPPQPDKHEHEPTTERGAMLDESLFYVDSVIPVWPVANWFEREAFDLYGIIFNDHPDLRRLLTDYGFIGHPFRKDFPLSGKVEMHYDEEQGRVMYKPVTVEERILVPRIIRKDGAAQSPVLGVQPPVSAAQSRKHDVLKDDVRNDDVPTLDALDGDEVLALDINDEAPKQGSE